MTKYSFEFDSKAFITSLRLNTQSPFGDEKQIYFDKKIGRNYSDDFLFLTEYDNYYIIHSKLVSDYLHNSNPKTLIWINSYTPLKVIKVSYPGLLGIIKVLVTVFLIFASIFFIGEYLFIFGAIALYVLFNYFNFEFYDEQDKIFEKVINDCRVKFKAT